MKEFIRYSFSEYLKAEVIFAMQALEEGEIELTKHLLRRIDVDVEVMKSELKEQWMMKRGK